MSAGPAASFGLERPRITVGARANLVLLDLQSSWRVEATGLRSRSANSWLLGKRSDGSVRLTMAAGRVVHESMTAAVVLEDGAVFEGESVGAVGPAFGEAVFTTAMSGYQEVATDPSFEAQIVCFTAPMVGNYGTDPGRSESNRAHARGVVMREARGPAWTTWLRERGVVALTGVDTRSLVLHLRDRGAMRAAIVTGDPGPRTDRRRSRPPGDERALLARDVSTPEPYTYTARGRVRVAVVDYGCKRSIVRRLAAAGAAVDVFPHDVDADTVASYDGVVLSPGPGDPEPLDQEAAMVTQPARPDAGARGVPRPSADRARARQDDLQAAVRPSRREPSGRRSPHAACARDGAEPRLRGRGR